MKFELVCFYLFVTSSFCLLVLLTFCLFVSLSRCLIKTKKDRDKETVCTQWSYAFWSYIPIALQLRATALLQFYSPMVLRLDSTTAQWVYVSTGL